MLTDLFSYFSSEPEQSTLQEVETGVKELRDLAAQARASGTSGVSVADIQAQLDNVLQLQDEFINSIYEDGATIQERGYEYDGVEEAAEKAKNQIEPFVQDFDKSFDGLKHFKASLSKLDKMEDALNQPTGTDELRAEYHRVLGEIIQTIQEDWKEKLREYQLLREHIPEEPSLD